MRLKTAILNLACGSKQLLQNLHAPGNSYSEISMLLETAILNLAYGWKQLLQNLHAAGNSYSKLSRRLEIAMVNIAIHIRIHYTVAIHKYAFLIQKSYKNVQMHCIFPYWHFCDWVKRFIPHPLIAFILIKIPLSFRNHLFNLMMSVCFHAFLLFTFIIAIFDLYVK